MRIMRGAGEKREGGVYVLTEETQTGWLARLVVPGPRGVTPVARVCAQVV
jgi:hypothetical protein